jgi:hypothetical protein|tara:strand:- start:2138 stop:4552 length:2415 start_codon:yes stop_codon:yes gene_type:complete
MANQKYINFPSQVVSDLEKMSPEYGLKIARAIEQEWFTEVNSNRYVDTQSRFHRLRLYARGEQSIQKYKDELSINGDLSYLNLDWKPVPIISKFVDIVVNGMSERLFNVKAYSQDQYGVNKRTEYMESIIRDMKAKAFNDNAQNMMGINLRENQPDVIPDSEEELDLHMQLDYKQAVEIAEEQAISVLLEGNRYDLIRKRLLYDLTVLGIGCVKTSFNWSEGVTIDYVDPANIVYSYTDSPYFDDIYYIGEIKTIPINELVREFPHLTQSDLEEIENSYKTPSGRYLHEDMDDKNKVQVLYFNYKTYMNNVYKLKETGSGAEKVIPKDDNFDPPENKEGGYKKLQRAVECVFEGVLVIGTGKLLKWNKAENMMRTKSDFNRVKMNYALVAPRMYNGKIESIVSRITGFADMIQLTHLKLQQVLSKMVPDGVFLDADGLAEIDLGNGTNYNPQEALNMFFQTGSVIGRSFTADGDQNPGKVPIQQIQNGAGGNKMQSLIQTYNYYLQMIRDVTGLNEARDASVPDPKALVGVQKLAAANSNVATRHILDSSMFLTAEVAEALSLRISDILEYSPTADAFVQAIGAHNVATLKEMSELYLYDFGIFIELEPDEYEKELLENNIQTALSQKIIDLDDAIDIREVKNIKLANQLLKIKRRKKEERDQMIQQQNMKAQADANAQAQEAAAAAEMQKNQQKTQIELQVEQQKAQSKLEYLQQEVKSKMELMQFEFDLNMKMQGVQDQAKKDEATQKEDRLDEREKIKGKQKTELEQVKQTNRPTPKFESSGNDILGGGLGLDKFTPKIGT